jgi:hypothetical protein
MKPQLFPAAAVAVLAQPAQAAFKWSKDLDPTIHSGSSRLADHRRQTERGTPRRVCCDYPAFPTTAELVASSGAKRNATSSNAGTGF